MYYVWSKDFLEPGKRRLVSIRRARRHPGRVVAFIEHYKPPRYHDSLGNATPADAYHGRAKAILYERKRIKY